MTWNFDAIEPKTVRTPTYRQWYRDNDQIPPPKQSRVIRIFKPAKYASWTFIVEAGFKVTVSEDSPIFNDLSLAIAESVDSGVGIFIEVTDRKSGAFKPVFRPKEKTEWKENEWGYASNDRQP